MKSNDALAPVRVEHDLDVRSLGDACRLCEKLGRGVKLAINELYSVGRVFDSGVALLRMLCSRLQSIGTQVIVGSRHPVVKRRLSYISTGTL